MTIVLVEGHSDRVALEVFARRLGLATPTIQAIGGAHAATRVAAEIREKSPGERILGLVDIGERQAFAGVVDQVFVCDRDLEDELIRAFGIENTLALIDDQGEGVSFGKLQKQPAQRDRAVIDQLRRFLHGRSGNKARYAAIFAEAISIDRIPEPIREVIVTTANS